MTTAPAAKSKAIVNRKRYMAGEISHHDYYLQFVTENLIDHVTRTFGIETLNAALYKDMHLNSIDLRSWDAFSWRPINADGSYRRADLLNDSGRFMANIAYDREAIKIADELVTRATLVCIAKTAAKVAIERYRNKHSR